MPAKTGVEPLSWKPGLQGTGFCRKLAFLLSYLLLVGFGSPGRLFPAEEKALSLGAENSWRSAERRFGITELKAVRPWPVLALDSGLAAPGWAGPVPEGAAPGGTVPSGASRFPGEAAPDLALSFDQDSPELFGPPGGAYSVSVAPGAPLSVVGPEWARMGKGAAFFSAAVMKNSLPGAESGALSGGAQAGPLVIEARDPRALFASGQHIRDFSLEFWLYPLNMENGEQILSWAASLSGAVGDYYFQYLNCSVVKNRLRWNFDNFFTAPGDGETLNITMNGLSPVVPKLWSHHLIRFDADTGLLEYLVNGRTEALTYTTAAGTEGGEPYTPLIGTGGEFVMGKGYTGMIDEFRIHRRYAGRTGREFGAEGGLQKYPPAGGRMETRTFDLGEEAGGILRLEALGGRITLGGNRARNEYAGQGDFRFSDSSAVQFFLRTGDNPYRWTGADWQVVTPGTDLPPVFRGRYIQLAAVFYPSADGETSPYLEELRVMYRPQVPPQPPVRLSAAARDGAVELSWRDSPIPGVDGYLVYYGEAPGEYFGRGASWGPSPIDAGNRRTLRIEGLDNGTLYYFAIAAYRTGSGENLPPSLPEPGGTRQIGEFSREVTARPLSEYTSRRYE
jgi:hypothetical protein